MANYDDTNGVWRTIGGRRVFIREGKSLSEAMKESGKFKRSKKAESKESIEKKNSEKQIEKEFPDNLSDEVKEQARLLNTRSYDDIDDVIDDFAEEQGITRNEAKYALLKDEFKQRQGAYIDAKEDGSYSDAELNHMESMAKDSYFKLQEAKEQLDSFNKDNRTQKELLEDRKIFEEKMAKNYNDKEAKEFDAKYQKRMHELANEDKDVWKKQADGTFKADKDAMAKSYEERHKKYDAKIKQLAEDREKMSNSDWEAQIMAYEKQDADGTYKTMQDIMDDVEEYSKKERDDYESKVFGTDVRKADEQMKKVFGENFRYAEEKESTEEPKTFFDGKRDIEEEARQIYAEDGIRATSDRNVKYFAEKYGIPKTQAKQFILDTAKRFDEENEKRNKSNDWVRNAFNQYKKDHPKSKLTLADFTRKNKK